MSRAWSIFQVNYMKFWRFLPYHEFGFWECDITVSCHTCHNTLRIPNIIEERNNYLNLFLSIKNYKPLCYIIILLYVLLIEKFVKVVF